MLRRTRRRYSRRSHPEFRRMPIRFRRSRPREQRDYGRWYGNYVPLNEEEKLKRFSFQVRVRVTSSNHKLIGRLMRITTKKLVSRQVPLHKQGQVFESFGDLLHRTDWIRVKTIRNYKAGVVYAR